MHLEQMLCRQNLQAVDHKPNGPNFDFRQEKQICINFANKNEHKLADIEQQNTKKARNISKKRKELMHKLVDQHHHPCCKIRH